VAFSRNSTDPNVGIEVVTKGSSQQRDGTFSISYVTAGPSVFVADFDGDGKQDLFIYGRQRHVEARKWGRHVSRWSNSITGPSFLMNVSATVGDFNGDGLLDVAGVNLARFSERIRMSLGSPGGTFSNFGTNFRMKPEQHRGRRLQRRWKA